MKVIGRLMPFIVVAFAVVSGCKTGSNAFDFDKTERRIKKAIANGQYETADRLLAEYEVQAAGGPFRDSRLLQWAYVKTQMGHYNDASNLVEQLLFEHPESPCRNSAIALKKHLQEKARNQAPEVTGATNAPQPEH